MQLLAGSRIIEVNQSIKEDRALFSGAQKVGKSRRTARLARSDDHETKYVAFRDSSIDILHYLLREAYTSDGAGQRTGTAVGLYESAYDVSVHVPYRVIPAWELRMPLYK